MVLAPGDIKAIATEIGSKIITELKKPVRRSFGEMKSEGVCETTFNNKETFIDSFIDHERRTHREIANERKQD